MTPDLDQSLSMKAQIDDKVTPKLQKMQRHAQTTREAVSQMVEEVKQGEGRLGASASKMSSDVQESTTALKKELDEVKDAFRETGDTATQSSEKIGQAIEDSMYSQGASSKLGELDDDLGKLGRTFKGMASTQKSVSGKARSISATAHDSLNTKVIPAFENLHATLDDYPDTLDDINKKEEDRLKMLEDGGGVVERMKGRLAGVTEAVDEVSMGIRDAVNVASAGTLGVIGSEVQERQTSAARMQGVGIWEEMPQLLQDITIQSRTTMSNVQPIMDVFMEMRAVPKETMAPIIADIYDIEKATGIAGEGVAQLRDQVIRLGGANPEEFKKFMEEAAYLAHETGASMPEMFSSLQQAGDQMIIFARDARTAFVESSMAAAASAKTMGMDEDSPAALFNQLLDSPEHVATLQGLFSSAGIDADVEQLMEKGEQGKIYEYLKQAAVENFEGYSTANALSRRAVGEMSMGMITPEFLARAREGVTTTGEGTGGTAEELLKQAQEQSAGTIEASSTMIRDNTAAERTEQLMGSLQEGLIVPGEKTIRLFGDAVEGFDAAVGSMAEFFIEQDRASGGKWSSTVAGVVAGEAAVTASKGVGSAIGKIDIPFAEKIGDAISGGLLEHMAVRGATGAYAIEKFHSAQGLEDIMDPKVLENIRENWRGQGKSETEIQNYERRFLEEAKGNVFEQMYSGAVEAPKLAVEEGNRVANWFKGLFGGEEAKNPLEGVDTQPPTPLEGVDTQPPTPLEGVDTQPPTPLEGVDTQSPTPLEGVDTQPPTPPPTLDMADPRDMLESTNPVVRQSGRDMLGIEAPVPLEAVDYPQRYPDATSISAEITPSEMSAMTVSPPTVEEQAEAIRATAEAVKKELAQVSVTLSDPEAPKQTELQSQMASILGDISNGIKTLATKSTPPERAQSERFVRGNYEDGDRFLMRREGRG